MIKEVKPQINALVTRSNKLIEARYKLTLQEQKILYAITSLIQPDDSEFYTYDFNVVELAKFIGINSKSAYREIEDVTKTLLTRVLTIREEGQVIQTHWVQSALYRGGTVTFELDKKLKPYLLGLKEFFTSIPIAELMSFRSQYTGRIYELLYQYRKIGSRQFTIEELRDFLGLEKGEYTFFADLRRFILEPTIKDINKNTPLDVEFELKKSGKKVTGVVFYIKIKSQKDYNQLEDDVPQGVAKNEMLTSDNEMAATSKIDIISRFAHYKINESDAVDYLNTYGEEYCIAQLEYLEERMAMAAKGEAKKITNIPKWLRKCMVNNYACYLHHNSEAAATMAKETKKTKKPAPNCKKCKGTGYYEIKTGDERYISAMTQCDCWE